MSALTADAPSGPLANFVEFASASVFRNQWDETNSGTWIQDTLDFDQRIA